MANNLKACPFCGSEAQVNTWTLHGITESRCFCSNSDCPNSVRTVALEQWNTRPIEDALNDQLTVAMARLTSYEKKGVLIKFMNEDELPESICDCVYSAMFNCSHVEGVRLFPYVEDSDERYFLVMLKEDE